MNKIKLTLAGAMVMTVLLLSFINNKKVSKVELTKYFESKEGYGEKVLWIDQEQWISATSGLINLWRKDQLKKTFDVTFYKGGAPVYNSKTHKLFAGTYILNLAKDT